MQLDEAIDLNVEYPKSYLRRAETRRKLKKHQEALEDYKKALEIKPEDKGIKAKIFTQEKKISGIKQKTLSSMEKPQKFSKGTGKKILIQDSDDPPPAVKEDKEQVEESPTDADNFFVKKVDKPRVRAGRGGRARGGRG